MAPSTSLGSQPETLILQILQSEPEGMPLDRLLRELHERNFSNDAEAKAGIWRLISEAAIHLVNGHILRAAMPREQVA